MNFAPRLRIFAVPEWPPDPDACWDDLEPEPEESSERTAEGEWDFYDE